MSDTTHNRAEVLELDAAFEAEIVRVSQLEFNSNEICRSFYGELRKRFAALLSHAAESAQQAPTTRTEPLAQDVVTDQDISDLVELAQHLTDVQHWAAQAGSKNLAALAKKLLDAKKASPATSASVQDELPTLPRFRNVSCSQCGRCFGPGEHGFSHCKNHQHLVSNNRPEEQ